MRHGPKQRTVQQRTLYKPKNDTSEDNIKHVNWYMDARVYTKVQNIHVETGITMRELMHEALKDLVKKYCKKGVIDKNGNPLK